MNIELEFDEEDHEDEVAGSLAIASDDEIDEDAGPIDDSDSEQSEPEPGPEKPYRRGTFLPAPTLEQVEGAVQGLQDIFKASPNRHISALQGS